MHVIYLPFADDLRNLNLDKIVKADNDQILNAKKVVKQLRIAFDSHNFENPALQKHYATLQALALDREAEEETVDYLQPDIEGMANFNDVLQEFRDSVLKSAPAATSTTVCRSTSYLVAQIDQSSPQHVV
jgi:ATP-dependent DNA helicase 2 subunit 1